MHVRATTFRIQAGKMPEAIDLYQTVISGAKTKKGFQGAYLMTDADSGKALSISIWESEADMLAGESSRGHVQGAVIKFSGLFVGSPEFEHYELSVEESMSSAADGRFARTGTGFIQQGKMDEVINLLRETNYPAYASQQGFKGAMLLTQSDTGKSVSITLWETEADTKAGDNRLQEGREAAREAQDNPPVIEYFEVSVQA